MSSLLCGCYWLGSKDSVFESGNSGCGAMGEQSSACGTGQERHGLPLSH